MNLPAPVDDLIAESVALEQAGQLAAALRQAGQALEMARSRGEPTSIAAALVGVARVRFRLGQYEAAQALAREALAAFASLSTGLSADDAPVCVDAWQILANCAAETDSLAEAERFFRRAADLAREIGYRRGQMAALHGLAAAVYLPRGQFDLALASDEESRRITLQEDWPEWRVYPLIAIAMANQQTARRAAARSALDELNALVSPGSITQGYHLCVSAHLALDEGDLEVAHGLCVQARSIAETSGEPWLNVSVRLGLSRYYRLTGDGPTARTWTDDALTFAARVGYRHEQGRALIERGRAAWLCDNAPAAEADLRAAAEILEVLGAAFDLARARFLLAALLHQQNRAETATAWLDAARSISEGGYAFLLEQERSLAFPLLAAYQNSSDVDLARACTILLDRLRRVPPPALRIVTLGRHEVHQGAHCIPKRALRQRRAGELLALLLLAPGHRLAFDQVAEALFPGKEPTAAQVLFHHATSTLRRALEPDLPDKFPSRYLEVEEGQVTLHLPPGSWLDLEAFEAHCRQGKWEEALALHGGDLLPDYRYADWSLAPRERLALLYQRALLAAAEAWLAEGRFVEALDACQRLLALEPWHEPAVLLGMCACAALNDLAGARRLYLKLEKTLHEELDTVPQPELQALYRSLTPPTSKL
jgi:DNA-binding SARP family transcriptional activator